MLNRHLRQLVGRDCLRNNPRLSSKGASENAGRLLIKS